MIQKMCQLFKRKSLIQRRKILLRQMCPCNHQNHHHRVTNVELQSRKQFIVPKLWSLFLFSSVFGSIFVLYTSTICCPIFQTPNHLTSNFWFSHFMRLNFHCTYYFTLEMFDFMCSLLLFFVVFV